LGVPIAMATIDAKHAKDPSFQIDIRGKTTDALPTKLPFYKRPPAAS